MSKSASKFRVAYFVSGGGGVSGMETHTVDLALATLQRGHQVSIVLPDSGDNALDPLVELLQQFNVPIMRLTHRSAERQQNLLINFIRLRKWLIDQQVDIFHLQRSAPSHSKWSILAARTAGVFVIVSTDHDRPFQLKPVSKWVTRTINNFLDATVVVSEYNRQLQLDFKELPKRKLHKIYNGIKLEPFDPTVIQRKKIDYLTQLNLPIDSSVIGTLGRLVKSKGLIYLLDAVASLHKTWPNLVTLIAGSGPQRSELERRAVDLGIEHQVHFLGYVPDARIFMAALDIFVLPSLWEAFGLVAAEAMATGKPVVATKTGGLPEVVAHSKTGLVVPMRDSTALANAIEQLLKDEKLRQQMGVAGHQRVVELFSVDTMADRTISLYQSLLNQKTW